MQKRTLQEISKFASGLVLGDFLVGAWFYAGKLLPMTFLGLTITEQGALVWMIFDVILFLLLVHYGWHIKIPSPTLKHKTFYMIVGVLLGAVAILHLLRLIFAIDVTFGGWEAPMWLSWLGTIVTGYLSYASFKFASTK